MWPHASEGPRGPSERRGLLKVGGSTDRRGWAGPHGRRETEEKVPGKAGRRGVLG